MQPSTPKFNTWLLVEKEAQAAERDLHAAMRKSAAGAGADGLADLALIAQAKRAKALRLFDEAMGELKNLAQSHRRSIPAWTGSSSADADSPH